MTRNERNIPAITTGDREIDTKKNRIKNWWKQKRSSPMFWGTSAGILEGVSKGAEIIANEVSNTFPLTGTIFRGIEYASQYAADVSGTTGVVIWCFKTGTKIEANLYERKNRKKPPPQ